MVSGFKSQLAFQREIVSLSPEKRCATVNVEILRGHRVQGEKFTFVALPLNEWVDANTRGMRMTRNSTNGADGVDSADTRVFSPSNTQIIPYQKPG